MTDHVPTAQRISGIIYCSREQIILSLSPTLALIHDKKAKDMWRHALKE